MDIKNVKTEQVDIKKDLPQAPKAAPVQKVEAPPPAKVEQAKPTDNAPVNPTRHYVVPDIPANANLLIDMNRVNSDIKMIDLKRYGYEQDIEKIRQGLASNTKDMNNQLHEINELRAKIAESDVERTAEISELKRKIDSGEYKSSGASIVDGIEKYRQ